MLTAPAVLIPEGAARPPSSGHASLPQISGACAVRPSACEASHQVGPPLLFKAMAVVKYDSTPMTGTEIAPLRPCFPLLQHVLHRHFASSKSSPFVYKLPLWLRHQARGLLRDYPFFLQHVQRMHAANIAQPIHADHNVRQILNAKPAALNEFAPTSNWQGRCTSILSDRPLFNTTPFFM